MSHSSPAYPSAYCCGFDAEMSKRGILGSIAGRKSVVFAKAAIVCAGFSAAVGLIIQQMSHLLQHIGIWYLYGCSETGSGTDTLLSYASYRFDQHCY